MKTIGLIGGTTWISTVDYYRAINEMTNERLGGNTSARILLHSFNFAEISEIINTPDWPALEQKFLAAAKNLESAGADCIVFCANTAHVTADVVRNNIAVPLIHIGEETLRAVQKKGITRAVGLLGTRFTMEKDYIKKIFTAAGITVAVPESADREFIHASIFDELGKNILLPATKQRYRSIIRALVEQGAEGIILGCTEIPLLITQGDVDVPVFDTTLIHAAAAVDFALS